MAPDRKPQVVRGDSFAIVDDYDQVDAAGFQVDLDPPRAGIDRVLDQLFYDRRRALDDFTGSDLPDRQGVEFYNGHGVSQGFGIRASPSPGIRRASSPDS